MPRPCNPLSLEEVRPRDLERFHLKYLQRGDDECWPWTGTLDDAGYGMFHIWINGKRRNIGAHRLAYVVATGAVAGGQEVCHKCDVRVPPGDGSYRKCVNPAHLKSDSHKGNMQEMFERGRDGSTYRRGIVSFGLTYAQVRSIRECVADGQSVAAVAALYDVDTAAIESLLQRRGAARHVVTDPQEVSA